MDYIEWAAPALLQNHVQCMWRLRADEASLASQSIYPDGRCELIVHLGLPMQRFSLVHGWQMQTHCLFAAQMLSGIRLAADARVDCVGVRLQPAAGSLIGGGRLPDMTDQVIDLEQIDPEFASAFFDAVARFAVGDDPNPIWQLLLQRIAATPPDALIQRAVREIDAAQGMTAIADLAKSCRVSLRTLQQRFRRSVGISAKEYARIRRLQETLRQLDSESSSSSLSSLSLDRGFADQAHASREVRRFTGLTPARLRRALRAEREGDDALRLAAAFVRGHGPRDVNRLL